MPFVCPGIPERPRTNLETTLGHDIGISPPENNGDEIASVIVKETLVVRANPMMDSQREAKTDKCPAIEVRTLWLPEWLLPANLEAPKWTFNLRVWLHVLFPVKTADQRVCQSIVAIGVPNFLFLTAAKLYGYSQQNRASSLPDEETQHNTHCPLSQQR